MEPKEDIPSAPTPKVAPTPKPRGRPRKDAEVGSGDGQQNRVKIDPKYLMYGGEKTMSPPGSA